MFKDFARDFAMEHPIATYFTVVGTIGTVCKYTVELVRSITGNYPPAQPISFDVTLKKEEKKSKELYFVNPFEDTEKEVWTDDDFS